MIGEHPTERLPRHVIDIELLAFAVAARIVREWVVLFGCKRAIFLAEATIADHKVAMELRAALRTAFGA